jgi:uncharacterized protein
MIKRDIHEELLNLSHQYPVVTVTGPRQAGKTTLARSAFAHYNYVNLEMPEHRNLALNDPHSFFQRFRTPLIIDEIQRAPILLSYIQVFVDDHNESGQFILTGSNQLQLNESITQSLAGRTALLKLLPFSINELINAGISLTRDEYISKGFLPRIYDKNLEHYKAYGNYLETYVERDLRQQVNIRNLSHFETFLKLLAGRTGQIVNLQALSNDIGISSTTLSEWLSVLEASFIIHRVYPYYENFGKRIIKSPKIYFTEIGLAAYLLGIQSSEQVNRDPLLGGLFENLVVNEILKTRYNIGMPPNLYFFRDNHGNEVVVFEKQRRLVPIEIKSAMTYHEHMVKGINYFHKTTDKALEGYLIYAGDLEYETAHYGIRNFMNIRDLFL